MDNIDYQMMSNAVDLAKQAYGRGFSPVGAVLVKNGQIVDSAHSQRKIGNLLHAEYILMRDNQVHGLAGFTLYTTLEPCIMCAGMAIVGKIDRVVYLVDDFWGGCESNFMENSDYMLSRTTVIEGMPSDDRVTEMRNQCLQMWREYLVGSGHEWAVKGMLGVS